MQYVTYAILSWAILTICGLPFAILLLPPQLRQLAIPFAPIFGYAYVAFVCFHLFRTNIGGTDAFAPYVALVPALALIALAWSDRERVAELFSRHAMAMTGLALFSFAVFSLFYLKLGGGRAVSISLYNADLGEFAGISRYMQEFSRETTVGFMGQSPDHYRREGDVLWTGASMVPAFISSLTGSEPFRLQSLVVAMVGSQGAAFVYAIARDSLAFNRPTSIVVGLLYAINPVICFVVWQAFGGQMITTALFLAITYLVMSAQAQPSESRAQFAYLPSLVLLLSGLFVTYHFMIGLVAFLLGCFIAVLALAERSWQRLWTGAALLAATLLLTLALNPLRVQGVLAMFDSLSSGNSGWFMPWLSPDAQLGFGAANLLGFGPYPALGYEFGPQRLPGIVIVAALAAGTIWCLMQERGQKLRIAFVLGLALPLVLMGLYYAVKEADAEGVLGSYRSFKVTSMFVAFTLLALGVWFGAANFRTSPWKAALGAILAVGLVAVNLIHTAKISARTERAHVASEELMQIRQIESMDQVDAVDVMDDDWHELFWAHYFLLRKPQAFQTFIYGGRVAPLVHPYRLQQSYPPLDLDDGADAAGASPVKLPRAPASSNASAMGDIFVVPGASDCVERYPVTSRLELCKIPPEAAIAVTPDKGWWYREPWGRWSGASGRDAEMFIDTPAERSVQLRAVYGELAPERTIALSVNGATVPVEVTATELSSAPFTLQPGRNLARFTANFDPEKRENDARTLGIKWSRVFVLPEPMQDASVSR